ncbi:hypothetical protein, partial [Carboxylicivirga sp. M1479]|uniref:hypothetical protein n=1 Tax=Carboxylicivirga sp. M1479 TaxID=2594476 RepID=UPI001C8F93C3
NTELGKLELYDLQTDIAEKTNLAEKYPDIVVQIEKVMQEEHEAAAIIDFRQSVLGDRMN